MATGAQVTQFRSEVSNSRLVTALVAGFVATHVATVAGYWFHGINLPDLGWPNFNGLLLLGTESSPVSQFVAGAVFHMFTGICFAIFYAFIVHPRLSLKNTRGGNIAKALIFSAVLATLSAVWWVPQLFNQVFQTDLGWFSQNVGELLGTDAWKPIVGIYLWHVIYGLNLGLIYSPMDDAT
ncbi:MAG: hypothetical protein ACRDT7_13960 [Microbacterium sp.]